MKNVGSLPFINKDAAVMPDVHRGMGATVGSVIPTAGAIISAAGGVDIGCGVMAVRTSIRAEHLPDDLAAIRPAIEAAVPHGRTDNGGRNNKGDWAAPRCLRLSFPASSIRCGHSDDDLSRGT